MIMGLGTMHIDELITNLQSVRQTLGNVIVVLATDESDGRELLRTEQPVRFVHPEVGLTARCVLSYNL
jgi:hypothetical protein